MTFQPGDLILNDRYRIEAQISEFAYGPLSNNLIDLPL
jgi:hypothetical protein